MHVKMWHALADAVIHRHESSVRFHGRFDCARQELHVFEVGLNLLDRQISQSFTVFSGNNKTMTGKNRTVIEKRDGVLVFIDNPGGQVVTDDLAEKAGRLGHRIVVAAVLEPLLG